LFKRGLLLLGSTSLAAMVVASPAFAQDTATAVQEPTATAQESDTSTQPAKPAAKKEAETATAPAADENIASEIVVTGVRQSLRSAQQLKRTSDSIIDAVVSEDIGKVPDNTGAEVLARLPGIQIVRRLDEGAEVLVRGLPDIATTFNGREMFSTDDRVIHWQDISASMAGGFSVYKTATSDLVEPGLGGLINISSRRPFDMRDTTISGEIKGIYNDQSRTFEPAGNVVLVKNWNTSIGEIGVALGASYLRTKYQNALRFDGATVVRNRVDNGELVGDPNGATRDGSCNSEITVQPGEFCHPDFIGNAYDAGTRIRASSNFVAQWRPSSDLEFYVEGLWSGYRGKVANDFYGQSLKKENSGVFSNVVLTEGEPGRAESFSYSGSPYVRFNRTGRENRTDLYQSAVGFRSTLIDGATVTGDFAYSKSIYSADDTTLEFRPNSDFTINAEFDVGGSGVFDLQGLDVTNADNFLLESLKDEHLVAEGDGWQGRMDVDVDTKFNWLPKIRVGVRGTTRSSAISINNRQIFPWWIPDDRKQLSDLPIGTEMAEGAFRDDPQRFRDWLAPSGADLRNPEITQQLRQYIYDQTQDFVTNGWINEPWAQTEQWAIDLRNGIINDANRTVASELPPAWFFDGRERTFAAYLQGKYEFLLGNIRVDGTVGTRLALTKGKTGAIVYNSEFVPAKASYSWRNVLPSFQSRIHLTDKALLRLAYTHTMTRPRYADLRPGAVVTRSNNGPVPLLDANGNPVLDANGNQVFAPPSPRTVNVDGGNPDLKPLTARNYDMSLEYYFNKDSYVSLALFYKDLWGFVSTYSTAEFDPETNTTINNTKPQNAGKGRIKGIEASFQYALDFLPGWLSGFGVQGNATYIDAKNAFPAQFNDDRMVRIQGVSKWTSNLAFFYEKGPISARASYNFRSNYVNNYKRTSSDVRMGAELADSVSRLDASISYALTDNFSLAVTGTNLLGKPWRDYRYYNATQYYPADVRVEGRYFGIGLRFKK
jgi:iron complex outermembrane receptor protein